MRRRVAGFTLLEALVALVIAAVCLASIFELQHQLVDGQRRYERALAKAQVRRDMLTLLRDMNPQDTPSGTSSLGPNLTLRWSSQSISDNANNVGFPNGQGTFTVQLYRVLAEAVDQNGRTTDSFSLDRLGWQVLQSQTAGGGAGARGGQGRGGAAGAGAGAGTGAPGGGAGRPPGGAAPPR